MSERRLRELRLRQKFHNVRYRRGFKIGPVTVGLISMLFLATLSVFYLTQTNRVATKGYEQSDLLTAKDEITKERETLEVEAARLASVAEIQKGLDGKNLVKAGDPSYIANTSKVAKK